VRDILIAPSILSADQARLGESVKMAEEAGADLIHVDIMDGHFVPGLTFGPGLVAALKKVSGLPLDVHLMVDNPDRMIGPFADAGADWISVHVEATPHLDRLVGMIREHGCKAGVALNPATPLAALDETAANIDFILLMTVNPGWGGQSFIPSMREKIRKLDALLVRLGSPARLEVDGGVKLANARELMEDGMNVAVAGSAVFEAPDPVSAVAEFKRIARTIREKKS